MEHAGLLLLGVKFGTSGALFCRKAAASLSLQHYRESSTTEHPESSCNRGDIVCHAVSTTTSFASVDISGNFLTNFVDR